MPPEHDSIGLSLDVERLRADRLAAGVGCDLVDPSLSLAQQFLAPPLQGLATFVNGDRFFQWNLALLEPLHDRFKFLDRTLEAQRLDVGLGIFGHARISLIRCLSTQAKDK